FLLVKERAWIEKVMATGVTSAVMALSLALGMGVAGVVAATLAGASCALLLGSILLARMAPGILSSSSPCAPLRVRRLLSESWPLMGTSMLAFLLLWSDVLLMGVFRDSDEVGVYSACARLAPAIMLAHESLGPIFIARLSDLFASQDWRGIRHLYELTARWAMWPGLVMAWTLVLFRSDLLALLGAEFSAGATALAVLASGKAVAASMGMSGRVFAVSGKARINLINMALLVGGNILLNLLWIPEYGALGAAAATSLSLATVRTLQVVELWFLHRMLPWSVKCLIPVLGISLLAGVTYPFRAGLAGQFGWLLPLALFLAGCTVLFLCAGVSEEDRNVWRALRQKLGR
ncbi:MAG: polysaccharide biosynthesis C-terminal domain-containing protein, partial [Verrucomicrobiales bacterium]|nr:polysaccharide biosynthesis C-terminal domain-containing protein [Verrucomicrobiales bacterium]